MHRRKSYNLVNVWSWMSIHWLPEQSCPVFNKLTRHEPAIQSKNQHLVSGQLQKNTWPRWAVNLSPRYGHVILVSGYLVLTGVSWSYLGCPIPKKYAVNQGCMSLCQPVIWSMVAILRDSTVIAAAIVRTRPRAIPLAMITMRKSTHGFPFVSHIRVVYGAPLGIILIVNNITVKTHILTRCLAKWKVGAWDIQGLPLWPASP